jgi:hypothetical protein
MTPAAPLLPLTPLGKVVAVDVAALQAAAAAAAAAGTTAPSRLTVAFQIAILPDPGFFSFPTRTHNGSRVVPPKGWHGSQRTDEEHDPVKLQPDACEELSSSGDPGGMEGPGSGARVGFQAFLALEDSDSSAGPNSVTQDGAVRLAMSESGNGASLPALQDVRVVNVNDPTEIFYSGSGAKEGLSVYAVGYAPPLPADRQDRTKLVVRARAGSSFFTDKPKNIIHMLGTYQ